MAKLQTVAEDFITENRFGLAVTKTHILKSLWLIFGVLTAGVCHYVVFVVWEVQKTRPQKFKNEGLVSKSYWQSSRLELRTAQLKTGLYCHKNTYIEESVAHIWCAHCWCVSSCCLCGMGGVENKASKIQKMKDWSANLNGRAPDWS